MNESSTTTSPLSRRTVIGAAAWAAPAIALVVASPAHAASTPSINSLTLDANIQVPVGTSFEVTATLLSSSSLAGQTVLFSAAPGTFTFPSGGSAVTDATGAATVAAKAPAAVGTYTIAAVIPALDLTATIIIQVTGLAIYTALTAPGGWKMSNIGISNAEQLTVGNGYYWALQDGVAYAMTSNTATWRAIKAPGKIAQLEVRPNAGGYAAAIGVDGTFYQTSDATTLVATPGLADIVQVSSGGARWVVRTRAGDVYYNNYSNTGSRAKWTQLPGVPSASSMMAYPFDSTEYIIALGSDGRIYTSVGLVPFVQHMQGLPGGLAPKKISVEAGRWAVLDSNGDFYHTVNSSQTGVWNKVNAPVPLASYSAYEGNSAYVHAIGTDGNPYQSNGSAFFRKPGTPDGQVVDVVIGSGTWTARTSSGDVYYTNTSNAVGGASANGTYTLITGASGITLHSSYWAGNYIIGVAPTAP